MVWGILGLGLGCGTLLLVVLFSFGFVGLLLWCFGCVGLLFLCFVVCVLNLVFVYGFYLVSVLLVCLLIMCTSFGELFGLYCLVCCFSRFAGLIGFLFGLVVFGFWICYWLFWCFS